MRHIAIAAALAAVAIIATLGPPQAARAGTIPCREVYGPGGGYVCGADVESHLFDTAYQVAPTQAASWADSMAMIIAYSGGEITQADILSAVFGPVVPQTLAPSQAVAYSTHSFTGANKAVTSTTATSVVTPPLTGSRGALRSIAGQLVADTPLLVITSRNAMVLTKIYYRADLFGKPTSLYAAVVRDPFPQQGPPMTTGIRLDGFPGQRFLTTAEYDDIQSVVQVSVANH
ncbi:MAG: hypothetical protein JO293_06565 [Candidatus Eremiobacteraeota bacterium]|nr:hypothetical protein [Candidatus Eremiobacteraeota bacterium]MBV8223007.1 hypothetical protein [Candidatus Eremiobacteraeota bacterium]MBV8281898.1 hypothetical protein [Candidatus Eremiobacteraeota bacterium]